ncbi:Di-sulfide bridge nucleocytoplasmic transport domain-containing protein [Phaeosphaeria sp. MPI-PUGE-AT-0046c]|nr:Di-sulfide bridge nucleocytoplasmic transport domain-containing protein [Phaeosphaeria sp. MPI-PUGE-AT-0046c]
MSRGHRGSTTPMEFEWTNSNGPTDPASPFMNIRRGEGAKKRTHSVLDSPSNRPYFYPQDLNKPLPAPVPAHVQNAWEPRTPASTLDFSSGGETPNTPGVDSNAATPDTQLADRMGRLASDANSPKKGGRRESWFKRAFMGSPSPVKERERERDRDRERHYSHKTEHRIQKRRTERSRSKKRTLRDIEDDESDNEPQDEAPASKEAGVVKQTYAMSIASFMHWIEAHPNLPSVLSYYLQLSVNLVLAGVFVYIIYCAWSAVLADVDIEASKYVAKITVETAACAKQYTDNRCRPDERVPAMEKLCSDWERCMNRDAQKVARASVTAKTFAMIFNSFVEEFSYKSMIFTAIVIFGGFNLSNWAFGLLRHQSSPQSAQQQQHQMNDFVPQTPQRVLSNGYPEQNQHAYAQNWGINTPMALQAQQQGYATPYGAQRYIEGVGGAPPLVHTQSMPALTMGEVGIERDKERERVGKTPGKRKGGIFLR